MTTPSLQKSFDTSLIDLNSSFSSTETLHPGQENQAPGGNGEQRPPKEPHDVCSKPEETSDQETIWNGINNTQLKTALPDLVTYVNENRNAKDALKMLITGSNAENIVELLLGEGRLEHNTMIEVWHSNDSIHPRPKLEENLQVRYKYMKDRISKINIGNSRFDIIISSPNSGDIVLQTYWNYLERLLEPKGIAWFSGRYAADKHGGRYIVEECARGAAAAGLTTSHLDELDVGEEGYVGRVMWFGMRLFHTPEEHKYR